MSAKASPIQFLSEHRPWLLEMAKRLCRDADMAEDLVQDVFMEFIAAFQGRPLPSEQVCRGWLSAMLLRRFLRSRRDGLKRWKDGPGADIEPDKATESFDELDLEFKRAPPARSLREVRIARLSLPIEPGPMRGVITVYSFTDDFNCTTAVTSIAQLLAQGGRRVLVLDWGSQAPGVETFLREMHGQSGEIGATPGLMELVRSFDGAQHLSWQECVSPVRTSSGAAPEIHVLSAGRDGTPDLDRLFKEHDLGRKLEAVRSEWLAAYDVVLVNSPSGVTDPSALCIVHLPDVLVALFTSDEQSIKSTKSVLQRATAQHARLPVDRRKLITVPLLIDPLGTSEERAAHAARELGELITDWRPRSMEPIEAIMLLSLGLTNAPASFDRLVSLLDGRMVSWVR